MKEELLKLAERVEKLSGPDREVDAAIALANGWHVCHGDNWIGPNAEIAVPPYSASLDAAMTLVPEGWHSSINTTEGAKLRGSAAVRDRDGGPSFTSAASTPALALCAASLRSLAKEK